MTIFRMSIIVLGALIAAGCSVDDARQLGYSTVQSMRQQQCQKAMADDCEQQQSYETYQRERQQIKQ